MNWLHRRLCASRVWRGRVERDLLPWALADVAPGGDAIEIGPGPGAATERLAARARHLTCVEIDRGFAARLGRRFAGRNVRVVCEDATRLSAADRSVDAVFCLVMLHHVSPAARQDALLAEAARVLRPGGTFVLIEFGTNLVMKALHVGDTFLPIDAGTIAARLQGAGFESVEIDRRAHAFRARARRAADPVDPID
jgi:ubiquinone/menaquinone biosynthesis C-methylase UbiE